MRRTRVNICFRALSMQSFCNKRTDSKLETYVKNALDNYMELYLRPIRISPCNFGVSFTDAHVKYTRYNIPPQNEKVHVKFSTVFHEGFETLDDHLKKNTGVFEITDVENELGLDRFPAVAALRMFLSEMRKHEECLKEAVDLHGQLTDGHSETFITALLGSHLLSRLVYGQQYRICRHNRHYRPGFCPCFHSNCKEKIVYQHIGFGHEDLWYGQPDVVLFSKQESYRHMVPVLFYDGVSEETEDIDSNMESLDIDSSNGKFKHFAGQALSHAITFAFYQSNLTDVRNAEPLRSLIPSLVITPKYYYLVMYDYVNDILLSSGHQDSSLWDDTGCSFNSSAILHIWMILNYRDFTPFLNLNVKNCIAHSSNVQNILQDQNLMKKTKEIQRKDDFISTSGNDSDDDNGEDLTVLYVNKAD